MEVADIVIKTEVDNSNFKKSINEMEKDIEAYRKSLEKVQKQREKLFEQQEEGSKGLKDYYKRIDDILAESGKTERIYKSMGDQQGVERVQFFRKSFLKGLDQEYAKQLGAQVDIEDAIAENTKLEEELKQKIEDTTKSIEARKEQIKKEQEEMLKAQKLQKIVGDINKQVKKNILSFGRWGLAIMGVRGAFSMIRNAMSIITQQDQQLASDLNYMKNALAYAFEPIVRVIVNLMKELMQIIGGIIYMWTGKNIFENANKSLKSANGQAKDLKKQLAGFDEMNILSDTSGGGGGAITPSVDFTNTEQNVKKAKEIVDWWTKLGEEVERYLNLPLEAWTKAFGDWGLAIKGVVEIFKGAYDYITGSLQVIIGIIELIAGICTGNTELIEKGIKKLLEGLFNMILGLAEMIKGFMDFVVGIGVAIGQKLGKIVREWIINSISWAIEKFNGFVDKIKLGWTKIRDDIRNKITEIRDWLTKNFGVIGTAIGNIIGGSIKSVVNKTLTVIEGVINTFLTQLNSIITILNVLPGVKLKPLKYLVLPKLAKGGIINMPGKGIPVGSAIGGERGQEGVIPLTDSQQMELLGQAIGKYINVNANIPIYVGNRQIAREIRKINAEDDFAYNG